MSEDAEVIKVVLVGRGRGGKDLHNSAFLRKYIYSEHNLTNGAANAAQIL